MKSAFVRRLFVAVALLGAFVVPSHAAEADAAVARISGFYDVLLDSMKTAKRTPVRARYDKLEAPVRATFDLAAMTRITVGPAWTTLSPEDQKALLEQFSRLTIATYANRFDGYSGEKFEVDPNTEARGQNVIVRSRLVKANGEPVELNYLVHSTAAGWQAMDVYLSGTISELATRRSEFGSVLKSGGPKALVETLKERADRLLGS